MSGDLPAWVLGQEDERGKLWHSWTLALLPEKGKESRRSLWGLIWCHRKAVLLLPCPVWFSCDTGEGLPLSKI